MPITFNCACGKMLKVQDQFAGKRVKCPACGGVATAPTAAPAFEVVEDTAAPPPAPRAAPARPVAKPVITVDDDDEPPRPQGRPARTPLDPKPERKRGSAEPTVLLVGADKSFHTAIAAGLAQHGVYVETAPAHGVLANRAARSPTAQVLLVPSRISAKRVLLLR